MEKQKKQIIKAFVMQEKLQSVRTRKIMNEKMKDENRIFDFLKKNKYSEKECNDGKVRLVAKRLEKKQNLIFEIMKNLNFELTIAMISFLVQKKKQNNVDDFIERRAKKIINKQCYSFFVKTLEIIKFIHVILDSQENFAS